MRTNKNKFTGKRFGVKSLLALAVTAMFLVSGASAATAANTSQIVGSGNTVVFVDVPNDYWAKDQIDYFTSQGIVDGYDDGSFRPEEGVTREEFCKLLVSTFGQALETPDTPTFADVPEDRWSYPYIELCSEFLTGYSNPFGGLPSFHPTEYATREDIAVALVRMMGYTDSDAGNKNYAASHFTDGSQISPGILPYVSIASEKGLISGYPDGSFKPSSGITRAETVVLLNRATKQAVTNINAELELSANVLYSSNGKTATISITAEEGTTVTVDGESVKMSNTYSGQCMGSYIYEFEDEGSETFTVKGSKSGKTKTVTVTAKYEVDAPVLNVNQHDQTVSSKNFTLSGTATDSSASVSVKINDESIYVNGGGSWSQDYTLSEGENVFKVVATNQGGKKTTKTVTIIYDIGSPTLTVNQPDQTVSSKSFTLSGKATDSNSSVTVTINGKKISNSSYYGWSQDYTLSEGENVFKVVATNESGKQTIKTVTITYTAGAPNLTINQQDQTVTSKSFTLSGKATDSNYSVSVTINGQSVSNSSYYGWSKDYTLSEGENVFKVVATNENGKQSTKTVTITYTVGAPTLTVNQPDQTVTSKDFTLSGKATDSNYSVSVTINGKSVSNSSYYGWSKDYTLSEGENVFTVVATNENGKQTTKTVTITYTVGAPTLTVNQPDQTVTSKDFTLSGKATDSNYSVSVTINGQSVSNSSYYGWSKDYTLSEGENVFTVVATNENGKQTTKTVTITLKIGAPEITFINCPETTTNGEVTIKGKITGENGGAMLFINDIEVSVERGGGFSKNYTLSEGENTFTFRAVNGYGKSVTETKTIVYAPVEASE